MKILTDSAADLTLEDIEENEIAIASLIINFPGEEIRAENITANEFYSRLKGMEPEAPTTSLPSPEAFKAHYEKMPDDEILSIHISSGLSSTFQSATIGAENRPENPIHLIDSMTLSGGQRFQVLAAAKAIKAGWKIDRIKTQLEKIRNKSEVIYTLETLNYLARGGRIGRVQALASSLLNIKPLIHVSKEDGKYSTVGKSRTIKRALQDLTTHLENIYGNEQELWVSVVHGQYEEKATRLSELIQDRLNVAKMEIIRISPVLGAHTGPGIVGATVVPMALMAEIK